MEVNTFFDQGNLARTGGCLENRSAVVDAGLCRCARGHSWVQLEPRSSWSCSCFLRWIFSPILTHLDVLENLGLALVGSRKWMKEIDGVEAYGTLELKSMTLEDQFFFIMFDVGKWQSCCHSSMTRRLYLVVVISFFVLLDLIYFAKHNGYEKTQFEMPVFLSPVNFLQNQVLKPSAKQILCVPCRGI